MASNLKEKVAAVFAHSVGSDEKLLEECTLICHIYNIDPQDLMWKWEALNFKPSNTRSEISAFTMDSLAALKTNLRRELTKESLKKPRPKPTGNAAKINLARFSGNIAKTINTGAKAGVVQVKTESQQSGAGPSTVVYRGPKNDALSKKNRAYRYMYEKISERSEALDDRIDEVGDLIRTHYNVTDLGDPSSSTDEEIIVIGRITHDADSSASTSKLTDATITLESSRMLGSGNRVPLRFDPALKIRGGTQGTGGIGLFPGAIVALKGKNGGGGWFLVTEILAMPPPKWSPASLGLPNPKSDQALSEMPFSMYVVSGPYTPETDLSYGPWQTFLNAVKENKPEVIVFIGPFVDVTHPKIKNGDVDSTPVDIFRKKILEPLRVVLNSCPGSIALLVPSIKDLVSQQAVFPQSELTPELSGSHPHIHLLPNPARFSVNDVSFAVTSVDVLFHLRKEELLKRGEEVDSVPSSSGDDNGTDVMANLCRHLLQQRSFYPIFPVPLDVSQDVNLDVTHAESGLRLSDGLGEDSCAPDVLILPSRLKHFSKAVQSTTALNPSFLTKGTYAVVNVAGTDMGGTVRERIRTDIIKLEG